jgi:hypothetical protein
MKDAHYHNSSGAMSNNEDYGKDVIMIDTATTNN